MNDLIEKIKQWSIERNLNTANPAIQALKLIEEIGELTSGILKKKQDVIVDSIGDIFVVLTIMSQQLNLDLKECVESAYEEIKDRKGKMINGVFVKESDIQKGE